MRLTRKQVIELHNAVDLAAQPDMCSIARCATAEAVRANLHILQRERRHIGGVIIELGQEYPDLLERELAVLSYLDGAVEVELIPLTSSELIWDELLVMGRSTLDALALLRPQQVDR